MYTTTKDETVQSLKASAQNLKESAREATSEAREDLRDTANKAGRIIRHYFNNARDEVSHAGETVSTHVRKNPVQSSLIALGVGVVLGALLRR